MSDLIDITDTGAAIHRLSLFGAIERDLQAEALWWHTLLDALPDMTRSELYRAVTRVGVSHTGEHGRVTPLDIINEVKFERDWTDHEESTP